MASFTPTTASRVVASAVSEGPLSRPSPVARILPLSCRQSKQAQLLLPSANIAQISVSRKGRDTRTRTAVQAEVATEAKEEFYDCVLPKPLGLKFGRGNDGGAYVIKIDARVGSVDNRIEVGDKLVKVSASFGDDIWEANNFGQVVYAIRTRLGEVYMMFKRNYGDMSALEAESVTASEVMFKKERAGGNYGVGTKEIQTRNYIARKEAERARRELFEEALVKFKAGQIEEALIVFENVLGMEPKGYVGDNFSRVTDVYRVTQYNIACCYSCLNQVEAGLEALDSAMKWGFEDYSQVRTDPSLAKLRESPEFKKIIDKYDEPFLNEEAISALKNFFNFGKK